MRWALLAAACFALSVADGFATWALGCGELNPLIGAATPARLMLAKAATIPLLVALVAFSDLRVARIGLCVSVAAYCLVCIAELAMMLALWR